MKGAAETGGDKNRSNEAESLGGKDKGKSGISKKQVSFEERKKRKKRSRKNGI